MIAAERFNAAVLVALGAMSLGLAASSPGNLNLGLACTLAICLIPLLMVALRPGAAANGMLLGIGQMIVTALALTLTHGRSAVLVFLCLAALAALGDWKAYLGAAGALMVQQFLPSTSLEVDVFTVGLVTCAALAGACLTHQRKLEELSRRSQRLEPRCRELEERVDALQIEGDELRGRRQQSEEQLANVIRQVQKAGIHVASATTTIAANAREQEGALSQQVAATSQITASTREIATTARELVGTVTQVAHSASETAALAEDGRGYLVKMQQTVRQMVMAADQATSRLSLLSEKAASVSGVVTTISKVAEQTNILSLNAAIESEKAGEYGRGFAVVSKEIRKLADQTAVATLDIGRLIKDMQSAVSSQVMNMEKYHDDVRSGEQIMLDLAGQLSRIIEQVQTISQRIDDVNLAMTAQAEGAEQISQTLRQVNQASQDSARTVREAASVVEQLKTATGRLQATLESCASV